MRRLLIRPGAIGDFIVSLPALESLRAAYTEVWCAGQNVPLARFADASQSIVASGLDRLGLLPADDVIARLRGFDSVISWYGTNRPEFRELIRELALPFEFLPALPGANGHAVEFYLNQARHLGANPCSHFPRIACPAAKRTFAAIHPFASSPRKRAPMEVFEAAAERLGKTMPVAWLCGPEERLDKVRLDQAVQIADLFELACWLRGAKVFVGNDSGISHLAAAAETPVVAFFRNSDAKVWAPRGPSVTVMTQPYRFDSR